MEEGKVTKAECVKIIKRKVKNSDFSINSFKQQQFNVLNGFLGVHSSLIITTKTGNSTEEHKFFVKSIPSVTSQRNFILENNGYKKEEFFYTKYQELLREYSIDILEGAIPLCYHTNGIKFVFEDLSVQDYVTPSSREALPLDYVKSALKSLAKLHASALILEEKSAIKLVEKFPLELSEVFHSETHSALAAVGSYKSGLEFVLDSMNQQIMKESVVQAHKQQFHFAKPSKQFRNTICHGDAWAKNLMFQVQNGKVANCKIVDFQTFRYGPPAQDVRVFLHFTTNVEFRRRYLEEVLNLYLEELEQNLSKFGCGEVITKEEFYRSYHFYKQFALMHSCSLCQVVTISGEVADELFSENDYCHFVLFNNKVDFMKKTFLRDSLYKKYNIEAMQEPLEFLKSKKEQINFI